MFDVFSGETEVLIKDGIANLYWYRGDLIKAWLRAGIPQFLCDEISELRDQENRPLTKRQQMDRLYEELRDKEYAVRLRISREFVRSLVDQQSFVPHDPKHRIEKAERAALKLKAEIAAQQAEQEQNQRNQRAAVATVVRSYDQELQIVRELFEKSMSMEPRPRGYALEKVFTELMKISGIPAEEPFSNMGEQLDGAIKFEGRYYMLELKWVAGKLESKHIGAFYFKVDGKMDSRGIVIAMNGFTDGVLATLPKGKEIKVILLDGNHLANVLYGQYTFKMLLEHAIKCASLNGELYCSHRLS
jgi:hypothetical protein